MSAARGVATAVATGVVVVVVGVLVLGVPPVWAVALALPFAAVLLLVTRLRGVVETDWAQLPEQGHPVPFTVATTLGSRLEDADRDPARYLEQVQVRMRRLAIAALRARPGMHDLTGLDDHRARAALGDELHTLITAPDARLPSPRRTAELLDELEAL